MTPGLYITYAHDHAKAASDATQTANSTVAINEHTLAAGEFSNAAKATSSVEALRTLRLLEQHHQKLSELLKFSADHPAKHAITEKDAADAAEKDALQPDNAEARSDAGAGATSKPSAAIPGLTHQRRYPPSRELSSSIASNLASARGIRASRYSRDQPLAPTFSNTQAPGNVDILARKDGSRSKMQNMLDSKTGKPKPSWVPPTQSTAQSSRPLSIDEAAEDEQAVVAAPADEGFSRFYSTFGSIINRLSAPLAFAGLPLIAEESDSSKTAAPEPPQRRHRGKTVQAPNEEPDLSKIYSKATLRSMYRDGHAVNDSFYVVPTSGHTVSYANILNFEQKEKRRAMAASLHGGDAETADDHEDEDFVDARESQMSLSPSTKRRVGKSQTERDLLNVIEELTTENASLKAMLDKVTKRLHIFEASAQHSRLALADSMRLAQPGSPMSHSGGAQGQMMDEALRKRNQELEEDLAKASQQADVLEKDNKRLRHNLDKYRDKWEALKAGAKARRDAAQSAENYALQKASRWRGKHGSPYNTTRMKLVFNAFAPVLFPLAEHCDPDDILNLRAVVLKVVLKFAHCVAHDCFEVTDTVKELWSLGVFHWKDCYAIVLGSAIAAPAPFDMGRKRGRSKKKKKGAQGGTKQRKHRPFKGRQGLDDDRKVARADVPSPTDSQVCEPSLRGDRAELQIHHDVDFFDPSAINVHDEGIPDLAMMDLSPDAAVNDDTKPLFNKETITECTGIDIFKAACSRDARDGLPAPLSSGSPDATCPYRSLEDAYVHNPNAKLSNLDGQTLGLAGEAVKQVVLQATYGFLQECIPVSEQQKVWDHILGRGGSSESEVGSIAVPDGILDLKNGTRPMPHLIGNCIKILSQDFSVVDQKSLKLAFNRGIALCDALNDDKRKMALECAVHSLNWLMLGLDCKTMEVYRHANQELDRINANYRGIASEGTISVEGICHARSLEERNLLWSMKTSFEKYKEPFRVNFIESLQRLVAAGA
ncbi:hypothetical protein VMCG_02289 [Cytospora schulzeri]|uniref:Uncharacterized protein n=1 Tax=Cytospora schulzeri TaxID=448051 RepID=A0A423X1H7_9PEZI|nr:hypothetical protein VMCG_02289 [Valsa malicola]